jgi:hypothetical protein
LRGLLAEASMRGRCASIVTGALQLCARVSHGGTAEALYTETLASRARKGRTRSRCELSSEGPQSGRRLGFKLQSFMHSRGREEFVSRGHLL